MKYRVLWLLLSVCLVATIGLPVLFTYLFSKHQILLGGILCALDAGALIAAYYLRDVISKSGFSARWSEVVRRAFGNLEATYFLAGFEREEGVRITLFVPHKNKKDCLVQITPYVPTGRYGSFKDCLEVSKGIVGKCYRTGEIQFQGVDNSDDYRAELIEEWGFTKDDVKKISLDKLSFLALPVIRKDDTVGAVVFLDAKSKDAFTKYRRSLIKRIRLAIVEWA
jgi:hypothetical protein